jgi:hypothetical protein
MIPRYIFYWALLLFIFGYACWRGRGEERIAASACLVATIVTVFVIPPVRERYLTMDASQLAIDIVMLATFVAIALRSDRFWPLWVAGLQLTMSLSHLMKAVDSELVPRAYAAAAVLWSYPILIIILVGTWRTSARNRHRDLHAA